MDTIVTIAVWLLELALLLLAIMAVMRIGPWKRSTVARRLLSLLGILYLVALLATSSGLSVGQPSVSITPAHPVSTP